MNRDAPSSPPKPPAEAGTAAGTGAIDSDWPDRERAARERAGAREEDDDAENDRYGNPDEVKDEGILESLGKAVSSPVRDEVPPPDAQRKRQDRT